MQHIMFDYHAVTEKDLLHFTCRYKNNVYQNATRITIDSLVTFVKSENSCLAV